MLNNIISYFYFYFNNIKGIESSENFRVKTCFVCCDWIMKRVYYSFFLTTSCWSKYSTKTNNDKFSLDKLFLFLLTGVPCSKVNFRIFASNDAAPVSLKINWRWWRKNVFSIKLNYKTTVSTMKMKWHGDFLLSLMSWTRGKRSPDSSGWLYHSDLQNSFDV